MRPQKISASMRTEERILANALQHFCDFGYHGTSVREITAASEVTKPTLYYYFKNKEELFAKLAQNSFQVVLAKLNEGLSPHSSLKASIIAIFNSLRAIYSSHPVPLRFIHTIIVLPQKGTPEVGAARFKDELDRAIQGIVERAVKNGECLEEKSPSVKVMISALFTLYLRSIMTNSEELSDSQKVDEITETLVECAMVPYKKRS